MTHYEFAEWLDYARGLGDAAAREAMQAHLLDGCQECRSTLAALEAFAGAVVADVAFEPPADVVRCAHALFAQLRPERVRSLPRILARLVEDTFRQPLPAGVRANVRSARQALYQAGRVFVDLRVEQRPGNREVVVVGQVLRPGREETGTHQPVVLTAGSDVLTTAVCNDYGEFHLECAPAARMRLHIPVEEGTKRVEISLNQLMPRSGRGRFAAR
jgi:anti-sigma factor ChrR (cupin superfamily)